MIPKFRAWGHLAGEEYRMFYDIHIFDRYMVPWADEKNPICDHTLMQYIGLKDKTGTLIYEGDLLRYPPKDKWEETNFSCYEVFFHDNDACGGNNIGWRACRCHHQGSIAGGPWPGMIPKTTAKLIVIGNIYTHPELLESKQ